MKMTAGIFQWLFLIFGLSICISNASSKDVRVVCYYTNWSVYRPGTAKFSPQNINPYLCTHLIYAFGGFTKENTLKPFDKYQDIEKGGYAKFTGLKTYNKDLKTLLAIGGWNEASSRFSPMVANPERRKQLVKNSIKFLRQNHFDGLDLDWEYPAFREGGKPRDKENYAKLVQELREEFERESEKTGRTRLLLTMAVPAGIEYINKGYDIPKLTKYLDWMNILSYDYHSAFEPAVNHHAPLYPLTEATEYDYDAELNIDYTIKHYLELGADPSKLVMGIPTYGRSYTLFNPDANAMGDPADGPGEMGEATRENGYLAYYEICENVKENGWDVVQPNEKAMGPYAFKENQWVGYDDENIARKKAEYVAQNGLGGIMFWAIDNDDFRGNCHGKPYPLIEAAKEALIAASGLTDENLISPPSKPTKSKSRLRSRPKTTAEPSTEKSETSVKSNSSRRRNRLKSKANNRASESDAKSKSRRNESKKAETAATYSSLKVITPAYTTPEPPSTPDQGGAFKCEDEGFFPHPKDCKKYFWCLSGPGELGIVAHQFTCPAGLYFNKAADSCDYSQNVLCNKKLSKTTSTTEGKKNVETVKTTTERVSTRAPATRTTTRVTSTTEEEYDDDYEYEDTDTQDAKFDAEEDPRVIKELLDLIKKAGGIEELEKQLNIGHENVKEGATTPSTKTKSIVEKLLSSRNKNSSGINKYATINRNSRGPQNAGVDKDEDTKKKTDRKPQYTTITRNRPSQNQDKTEESEDDEEEIEEKEVSSKYSTIRRSKEGSTIENRKNLNRNKILGEEDRDTEDSNRREVTVHTTPQYVNIRRQRPTTIEPTSSSKYVSIRRSTTSEPPKGEVEDEITTTRRETTESPSTERQTPALRYQTLNRQATSTTQSFSTTNPTTTIEPSTEDVITTKSTTEMISESTTVATEEPTSSPSSSTVETSTFSTSTEEPKIQTTKSPVLFEPRPFSVEQKSSISTTYKPVRTNIRSTTSPTKVSDTTVRSRFRRPFLNRNTDNNKFDGVSDNNVESENSNENAATTRRPLRSKTRFSKPDTLSVEDTTVSSKPAFRQRTRPLFSSSTQKTLNDREQDEIQRKYRPLSLDDLSSLTAADISIQAGNRGEGFRRTRIRTTTTEYPKKEVSTSRRKTFERNRILSPGRNITQVFQNSTPKDIKTEEQNEIRTENRPSTSELFSTSEAPKKEIITTRRRILDRIRISSTEKTSFEINNDFNDQVKSSSDEVQLAKEDRNELTPSSTENIKRPAKRMRKVLRRLRTSTISPNTAEVTNRGKPLSYASLNLEEVTSSERSSSETTVLVVDSDSEEVSNSDETIEEGENIKLSATNIRENSNINNDNAIQDIGFRKFKKADVVYDKTRYGTKFENVPSPTVKPTTTDSFSPRTRKFIRRLRPTENSFLQKSETTKSDDDTNLESKIGQPPRGRKVIRRLRPTSKSNFLTETELNKETIVRKNQVPQFIEKKRQYSSRGNVRNLKISGSKRRFTTPTDDSVTPPAVSNKYESDEDDFHDDADKTETTSQRGTLKYNDIVRSTLPTTISHDENQAEQKYGNDGYKAFYFTTPQTSTLNEASVESSSSLPSEETTSLPQNQSNEIESSTTLELSEKNMGTSPRTIVQTQTENQQKIDETTSGTTEVAYSITASQESTSTLAELSTMLESKTIDHEMITVVPDEMFVETHSPTSSPLEETTSDSSDEEDSTTISSSIESTTPTTTTEYIRKSTLRSSRLRPTYQIRRLSTSTETSKENTSSERTQKFFTRKKPSFRQKITTESSLPQKNISEKPRRKYPFSKYGRFSTTTSYDGNESETTEKSPPTIQRDSSTEIGSGVASSTENLPSERQRPAKFSRTTTEVYQTTTESISKSDSSEKQRLRNKSLFSKKRKMNIPVASSSEIKEESTTEHYTTLYHVFAEPEINENETNVTKNSTQIDTEEKIEPLVEINRIIEVHIKNGDSNTSGLSGEAKSIFDKIGAINRVTSIKVVDGNGTKIADLPLDQTSQRLTAVHDIIEQEKKNEERSEHRKDRKFNLDVQNIPINELSNQQPEIIDGISHIKVITAKPILTPEVSTIALEALFSTTEKPKTSQEKTTSAVTENELLDTEYSRFVNIRIIKPVDGRSISDSSPADTPKVVKIISSDEEVTMEAKVVEVTPKNSEQTIRIAPIQVAMARTIADTPIVGISRLNEKISNTPFRPSLDSAQ